MNQKWSVILFFAFISIFSSCRDDDNSEQAAIDEEIILEYIAENNLAAQHTESGLYYVVEQEGNGEFPVSSSTVRVAYRGYLTNGNTFDLSPDEGISFSLNQVIAGWQEGIPLFSVGGRGKLLVPSALGYGGQPVSNIPANSVLIFDIHLIRIE